MNYKIVKSSAFRRSMKKFVYNKVISNEIETIINRLANDELLEQKYHDHPLKGKFTGLRECHVKPDVLLIYQKNKNRLILTALDVGSHSELFG